MSNQIERHNTADVLSCQLQSCRWWPCSSSGFHQWRWWEYWRRSLARTDWVTDWSMSSWPHRSWLRESDRPRVSPCSSPWSCNEHGEGGRHVRRRPWYSGHWLCEPGELGWRGGVTRDGKRFSHWLDYWLWWSHTFCSPAELLHSRDLPSWIANPKSLDRFFSLSHLLRNFPKASNKVRQILWYQHISSLDKSFKIRLFHR